MARLGFLAVLMVVLGSVGFGLDWQSAPMSPMPDSGHAAQAAVAPATPPAPISQPAPPAPATVGAPAPPAAAASNQPAPQIACNVSACARAYRSFQASDCSYQPIGGPRRRCDESNEVETTDSDNNRREYRRFFSFQDVKAVPGIGLIN